MKGRSEGGMTKRHFFKIMGALSAGLVLSPEYVFAEKKSVKEIEKFVPPSALLSAIVVAPEVSLEHPDYERNRKAIELAEDPQFKERDPISEEYVNNIIDEYENEKNYEFWHGEKLKLRVKETSVENMIARVMMSEETNIVVAGFVAMAVINRYNNYRQSEQSKKCRYKWSKIITGKDASPPQFSEQKPGVPFASDVDPLNIDQEKDPEKYARARRCRVLARMLLNGDKRVLRLFDYGQTHFMHPAAQDYFSRKFGEERNPPASVVHQKWLENGMIEIVIPRVNQDHFRLYLEINHGRSLAWQKLSDLGGNIRFLVPKNYRAQTIKVTAERPTK